MTWEALVAAGCVTVVFLVVVLVFAFGDRFVR